MLESITLILAVDDEYDGPALPESPTTSPRPTDTGEAQQANNAEQIDTAAGNQQNGEVGGFGFILPLLLLGLLIWIILVTRSQSKERKKHQSMISNLKKGDRIQTVGGIIGTIVDLRDDEVVVKVDENANTRLRFVRNAVKTVVDSKESE